MNLDSHIEALLFWKGEPISIEKLTNIFAKSEEEVVSALKILEEKLTSRGIKLLRHENTVTLGTTPEVAGIIERLTREELSKDLGKAGLETLSIILYRGPIARRDIDYIRGVNSNFILRNLLIRGLVEKIPSPKDQRSFLYKPTLELISYLGIQKLEDLPEYEKVKSEIESSKEKQKEEITVEEREEIASQEGLEDSH